jgi:integrase
VYATLEEGFGIMAKRQKHRLTAREVQHATRDLGDGFGLWVQYTPKYDSRSWLFRYRFDGADKQIGLGSVLVTSLSEARRRAEEARNLISRGIDPRVARDEAKRERMQASVKRMTFQQALEGYIEAHRAEWKSAKHLAQWKATLKHTAAINGLDVAAIDTPHVLNVLKPIIWKVKTETASRTRARIEMALDYAKAARSRSGDNPARWEALKDLLPAPSKLTRIEHHAALPYADVPTFMAQLRDKSGVSARALEFAILTAARVGEVIGARWSEMDLQSRVWTVPGERMKAGVEHTVPLSTRALEILNVRDRDSGELVFPGRRGVLDTQSIRNMLESIHTGITIHGFRSSFRDWCGDETNFAREVAEAALAHKVGDGTEQSYRRGSAIERRRKLMDAWAAYCARAPAKSLDNIVPLKQHITKV